MSEPAPPQPPGSPRSPRPNNDGDLPLPATTPGFGPGVFVGQPAPPAPRQSVSSLLMLTMFFFFMSGNGPAYQPVVGPDGEFKPHLTELQLLRTQVGEYTAFLNGTGNWTEVSCEFAERRERGGERMLLLRVCCLSRLRRTRKPARGHRPRRNGRR